MSEVNETMIGLFPSKARALEDELASINRQPAPGSNRLRGR